MANLLHTSFSLEDQIKTSSNNEHKATCLHISTFAWFYIQTISDIKEMLVAQAVTHSLYGFVSEDSREVTGREGGVMCNQQRCGSAC